MPARRSIVLEGQTTSISLEDELWVEFDRQAAMGGLKWQVFARKLLAGCPADVNRASFIRESLVLRLRTELARAVGGGNAPASTWVVDGVEGVRRYDFQKPLIFIGRKFENDIRLGDASVSKRHLMMAHDGSGWWAVDLDSKNGTWTNTGERVVRSRFAYGEKLRVGYTDIINIS